MKPYLSDSDFTLYNGDAVEVLRELPAESVQMCVTSPPFFGLRDYQCTGQIGLEATPEEWVASLVAVFEEVRRVLRKDGTLWIECGDSYGANVASGSPTTSTKDAPNSWTGGQATPIIHPYKPKDLIGQPFMLAFALREAGWYWRNVCVWSKTNSMPESVRDRFSVSHSYVLLFSKSPRYFMDMEAVREPHSPDGRRETRVVGGEQSLQHRNGERWPNGGRNARTVWTLPTEPLSLSVRSVRRVHVAADAASYGMTRTTSPDCPVHAGLPDGVHTPPDGGRGDAESSRSERSDDRLAPAPPDESAATSDPIELAVAPGTEDALALGSVRSATSHSKASSKTGHAPATTSPGSASARTTARTGDTSASPLFAEPPPSTDASRSEAADSLEDDPLERIADDIARRCTCSYTGEITEETGHYAAFPQALAERCIKAGTSERGCCPECGAPWVREVAREQTKAGEDYASRMERVGDSETPLNQPNRGEGQWQVPRRTNLSTSSSATLGWLPSCDCRLAYGDPRTAELHLRPIPCTILDPFLGSGTTALVARRLNRRCIGIELSPDYCALAAKRTQQLSLEATA